MEEDHADLEVATVLAGGLGSEGSGSVRQRARSGSQVHRASTLGAHGESPFRTSTVMTNMSRGNTATVTPSASHMTIHLLAAQGELVTLKAELEEYEHDVDARDEQGLTPLAWASAHNQSDTLAYLLQEGANPNTWGDKRETPLMLACVAGHDHIVSTLLKQGVEVNCMTKDQNTALLYAAHGNHPKCVRLLLRWGADMTPSNSQGVSALDVAVHNGFREVQAVIERHMLHLMDPT